jgi:hypothetical protein
MRVTIDLTPGEAHGLINALEYFAETKSREYLSPPTDDSPGERIEMLALLRKVLEACIQVFP